MKTGTRVRAKRNLTTGDLFLYGDSKLMVARHTEGTVVEIGEVMVDVRFDDGGFWEVRQDLVEVVDAP